MASVSDGAEAGDAPALSPRIHAIRVQANAERAVELFFRLSAHLDPIVDVAVTHLRDGGEWEGELRFLPEVRDALGRLRWPLATYGGVEISLYTADDQLTLTSQLELVIYARGSRWRALMEAEDVSMSSLPARQVWRSGSNRWNDAPELSAVLAHAVERLSLRSASPATALVTPAEHS